MEEKDRVYTFDELLSFYKKSFLEHWKEEKYKWQAIRTFQDNWNIDAEDFKAMFKVSTSGVYNLLGSQNYYPQRMIINFSDEEPEKTRSMFKNLYDESADLRQRVEVFQATAKAILEEHNKKNPNDIWQNDYQTENAISVYLWLKYPDKYYIYKFSEFKNFAEKLGKKDLFKKGRGIENLLNGIEFYDEIAEKLNQDSKIKNEEKSVLTQDCWQDSQLRTLTVDFGFHIYKYFFVGNKSTQNGDQKMSTTSNSLVSKLKDLLLHTHNLILHGAPGTGKTHLAHEIAKELGCSKNEVGFVQFHPSYDYTDFVEGLRPVKSSDGTSNIGFERKDGVFKEFCKRALKNLTDSKKSVEDLQKEISTDEQIGNENNSSKTADELIEKFQEELKSKGEIEIKTIRSDISFDVKLDMNGNIYVVNSKGNSYPTSPEKIRKYIKTKEYDKLHDTYEPSIGEYILEHHSEPIKASKTQSIKYFEDRKRKPFLFIIDEINRGELSKIFGELFYAIEPGYRVKYEDLQKNLSREKLLNTIRTQYANLETCGNEFDRALGIKDVENFGHFIIPDNVYIIGTMNDIDRSVDTMDFAFRRRFTFYEVKAEDAVEMLDEKTDENGNTTGLSAKIADEAKNRMKNLNNAISKIDGLNSSYHIGGAYFLKLNELSGDFAQLWNYHLEGLLREYLRGRDDAKEKLGELKEAYDSKDSRVKPENDINRKTENDTNSASHSERSEESADE